MIDRVEKVVTLQRLYEEVLFGIIRAESCESAIAISEAVIGGGLQILEISLNTPGALSSIDYLTKKYRKCDVIIGVGTVLDATSARLAIDVGSRFIVSPNLNKEVITMGNRYGIPVMPGIATVSELVTAMEWGADVVKGFSGDVLGFEFIKSLKNPIPQARVIPVGGISRKNMQEWLDCGAYALGIGSGLTHPNGSSDDLELIKLNTSEFLKCVEGEKRRRK